MQFMKSNNRLLKGTLFEKDTCTRNVFHIGFRQKRFTRTQSVLIMQPIMQKIEREGFSCAPAAASSRIVQ